MTARHTGTVGAVVLLALFGLPGCAAPAAPPGSEHQHHSAAPAPDADAAADAEFNEQDVLFSQGMIPHHAQAVEMSEVILAKDDVDPRVVELAERIRDAQGPEIERMTGWLELWGQPTGGSHAAGMDHDMEGMLSDGQIDALRDADGRAGARLFLEGMIAHHMGAVIMAERELHAGAHPAVRALAEQIIADQQSEIDTMQELLAAE